MSRINYFVWAVVLCLSVGVHRTGHGFAKDKMAPEQVAALHLKALGSLAALAELKTLAFVGTTSVEFIQGMHGTMSGTSMCVSDGSKLVIVLKYEDINYPGEYFAYDGKEVTVGHISPGQRSPLADFLFRHNGVMKEGLLGGVFARGWPFLSLKEKEVDLSYHETEIEDRRLHEIEYRPKKSLRDMKIKLYFDMETNCHVRTEYRVRVRDDMSAARAVSSNTLSQGLPDSIYVLVEKFNDFKKVGELMLPHSYTMDYSVEGQGHTFIAKWTLKAAQWAFNQTYDERIFAAQK